MTVIDSLVLELGLDGSKFTEGQKAAQDSLRGMLDQLDKGGKQVDAQGKKLNEFFATLKREALYFTAAIFGASGVKEFVTNITNVDAAAGRMSKTLSVSTQELAAWQGVARQTGGSAETIGGSLQGMTDQMNRFLLTGEGSFLPVLTNLGISLYDANKNLKTSTQLFLDLNRAVQGMDPARARSLLTMLGIDTATVNMLLTAEPALRRMLADQAKVATITKEDAEAAQQLTAAWTQASDAATQMGRSITTYLTPALVSFLNRWRDIFAEASKGHFVSPDSWLGRLMGLKPIPKEEKVSTAQPSMLSAAAGNAGPRAAPTSPGEQEDYIRAAAVRRGIDPNVAVAVARSEGLNSYVGDMGTSFGPFQLHYKNNIPGLSLGGLGDKFTKDTGLDARDRTTWKQQVDFALDEAAKGGWSPWHGWRGSARAGLAGATPVGAAAAAAVAGSGSSTRTSSSNVTIGKVEVHTNATDAEGIAGDIKPALERSTFSAQANYGQQ